MTGLALTLLGPFEARLGGVDIGGTFRTEKERALLAYLATERDRAHNRDFLAELFWPERPEGFGRTNLRQALSGARRALNERHNPEPFLIISDEFIQFNASSPHTLDIQAFEDHLHAVLDHDHPRIEACPDCLANLRAAVELYRGDFLSGLALPDSPDFQEWALFRREQYFGQLLGVLQQLGDAYLGLGDREQALQVAMLQVQVAPLEESGHRRLMYLLATGGRRSSALEQFQTCRRLLYEELRVEPAAETAELYEKIRRGDSLPLPGRPHRMERLPPLPPQMTAFVDRDSELAWVRECLRNPMCRLITLVGMPGAGKTRLALQAAEAEQGTFADGVHYLALEGSDTNLPLSRHLANALPLPLKTRPAESEQLFEYLRTLNVLLVLDGLDGFLDQAHLLIQILKRAPNVNFLVTSSRRLQFQTACVTPLHGLAYPQGEEDDPGASPAVVLFLERARRSRPGFRLDERTLPAVLRICRLVDGLPLAIELAAERLRTHTADQIARELEHDLNFLAVDLQDVPERQRSLCSSFEPAWQRLPVEGQTAFRRLAVFRGGFSIAAAEAVAEVSQRTLFDLADRSLLQSANPQRFSFHPLMHLFAGNKLAAHPDEDETLQERHARYFRIWLEDKLRELCDCSEPGLLLDRLRLDLPNLEQAAGRVLQAGRVEEAARFVQALHTLFDRLGDLEAGKTLQHNLRRALERAPFEPAGRAYLRAVLDSGGAVLPDERADREAPAVLIVGPDERIVHANPAAARLTGRPHTRLLEASWPDLQARPAPLPASDAEMLLGAEIAFNGGSTRPVEVAVAPVPHAPGSRLLVIRDNPQPDADSAAQPAYDSLTGLPGRLVFEDRLAHALALARRSNRPLAVLQVSLENLPELQSSLTPELGSALVQAAGQRLDDALRSSDTIARWEPETFCLLAENLDAPGSARTIARKILAALEVPFIVGGEPVCLEACLGGCVYPSGRQEARGLLEAARAALALARALGRRAYYLVE